MNVSAGLRSVVCAGIVFLFGLLPCRGQAWTAPKGEASVALTYQYSHFLGHIGPDGKWMAVEPSRAQGVTLLMDYAFTDHLSVSASLPYTATQNGLDGARPRVGIDDGNYHSTWQDYHLEARYKLLDRPLVVTPFVMLVQPSHAYTTTGEAAIGRDLREIHAGLNAGRLLDPALPNAYVEIQAGFVYSQRYLGIGTNRTIVNGSAGYFVTTRASARLLASYQLSHGGLTCGPCEPGPDLSPLLSAQHDRLLRDSHLQIGFGGSFAVTRSVDAYAAYLSTVWGENSHYGHGIALGVSKSFSLTSRD
jgi:hypothetical protein